MSLLSDAIDGLLHIASPSTPGADSSASKPVANAAASTNPIDGAINSVSASDVINGVGDFLKWIAWLFNPINWLRAAEFTIGILLMGFGLWTVFRARPLVSSGSGVQRVTRELAAATPVGRATNVARGRRMGRREGQIEHGRLEGRREQRKTLSESDAKRTQKSGQKRRRLRVA